MPRSKSKSGPYINSPHTDLRYASRLPSRLRNHSKCNAHGHQSCTGPSAAASDRQLIGRVTSVTGSTATIELSQTGAPGAMRATVGKFLGIVSANSVIVGMVTEISEQPRWRPSARAQRRPYRSVRRDQAGRQHVAFSRGVNEYPAIGESAMLMNDRELRLIYGSIGRSDGRHLASGSEHQRASRYRRIAQQAFRHSRHHRRRQIQRRRHHAAADSRNANPICGFSSSIRTMNMAGVSATRRRF